MHELVYQLWTMSLTCGWSLSIGLKINSFITLTSYVMCMTSSVSIITQIMYEIKWIGKWCWCPDQLGVPSCISAQSLSACNNIMAAEHGPWVHLSSLNYRINRWWLWTSGSLVTPYLTQLLIPKLEIMIAPSLINLSTLIESFFVKIKQKDLFGNNFFTTWIPWCMMLPYTGVSASTLPAVTQHKHACHFCWKPKIASPGSQKRYLGKNFRNMQGHCCQTPK